MESDAEYPADVPRTAREAARTTPSLSRTLMHRDHKLGLALGVLLVGFAAALCFPRQQPLDAEALGLQDAAALDEQIEQLPVRAYTDAARSDAGPSGAQGLIPSDPAANVPVAVSSDAFGPPPDPIPRGEDGLAPGSSQLTERQSPGAAAASSAPPPRVQTYVVRPGDTLSTIAARCLGSSQRYQEIFDANRDVLANPNALQVGMELRLPPASRERDDARSEGTERAPVIDAPPSETDRRRAAARFQPVGRAPFIRRNVQAPAAQLE